MDEMDLIREEGNGMRYIFREVGQNDTIMLLEDMEYTERIPQVVTTTIHREKPLIRFFCDFPTTYPDDKKFGLQFTCLRLIDAGRTVVIKRDDEFHTMKKHIIPHETPLLPFIIQKSGLMGNLGKMSRELITVVLSPNEFFQLLEDLTRDEEITVDNSKVKEKDGNSAKTSDYDAYEEINSFKKIYSKVLGSTNKQI